MSQRGSQSFPTPSFPLSAMATLLYNPRPSVYPSRALSTMLANMLGEPQASASSPAPAFVPAADILESKEGFELHLALPGVKREAVNVEFLNGQLVVSGSRPNPVAAATEQTAGNADAPTVPAAAAAAKFRRLETGYGTFSRSFRLPDTVNVKAIGAELADGILRVTLPYDTGKVTKQHIEIR